MCPALGHSVEESSRDNAALTQTQVAMLPSRNKVTDWARTLLVSTQLPTRCRDNGEYPQVRKADAGGSSCKGPSLTRAAQPQVAQESYKEDHALARLGVGGCRRHSVGVGRETGNTCAQDSDLHKTTFNDKPTNTKLSKPNNLHGL